MKKSRLRNALAAIVAAATVILPLAGVNAAAVSVEYSASYSYKTSKYYTALMNVKLTGNEATDVVNIAKSQIGYHESNSTGNLSGTASGSGNCTEYGRWYGMQSYWCNMFVSWCGSMAGIDSSVFPKLASATNAYFSVLPTVGAKCFRFSGGDELLPGDIFFSCTCSGGYGCIDHVGIIADVDDSYIYTVEGNLSDCVKTVRYPVSTGYSSQNHARINYIARPRYSDNTKKLSEISDADFVSYSKTSVYALFDASVSLKEAKAACEKMGGHLVTIGSKAEQSAVAALINKGALGRYYTGLSYSKKSGKFAWCTDEKVKYNPVSPAPDKSTAFIADSGGDFICETVGRTTGFICEIDLSELVPANSAVFGGSRYEIYDAPLTLKQATAFAKALGGKLAVIESDTENMLLSLLLKKKAAYLTGITGTKKELLSAEYSNFEKNSALGKNSNTAVITNDKSGDWNTLKSFSDYEKTGFIVEYDEEKKVTVKYDANGGTETPIEQLAKTGAATEISGSIPKNGNKSFCGWSASADSEKAEYLPGEEYSFNEDTVLYAVWQKNA